MVLKTKFGQSGIEFLAVTGIGLLLLVGVSFFLLSDSKAGQAQAELRQVQQIGSEILTQARVVQAQGRNSWVTLEAQIPSSVFGVYTVENNTLVFDVNTVYGPVSQPLFSPIQIVGAYDDGTRGYLYNTSNTRAPGVKSVRVFSNGTIVILSFQ